MARKRHQFVAPIGTANNGYVSLNPWAMHTDGVEGTSGSTATYALWTSKTASTGNSIQTHGGATWAEGQAFPRALSDGAGMSIDLRWVPIAAAIRLYTSQNALDRGGYGVACALNKTTHDSSGFKRAGTLEAYTFDHLFEERTSRTYDLIRSGTADKPMEVVWLNSDYINPQGAVSAWVSTDSCPLGILFRPSKSDVDVTCVVEVVVTGYYTGKNTPAASPQHAYHEEYAAILGALKRSSLDPDNSGQIKMQYLREELSRRAGF